MDRGSTQNRGVTVCSPYLLRTGLGLLKQVSSVGEPSLDSLVNILHQVLFHLRFGTELLYVELSSTLLVLVAALIRALTGYW